MPEAGLCGTGHPGGLKPRALQRQTDREGEVLNIQIPKRKLFATVSCFLFVFADPTVLPSVSLQRRTVLWLLQTLTKVRHSVA